MEPWPIAINMFSNWLLASGLATGTVKLRRHYLGRLSSHTEHRSPWLLSVDDLASFLARPDWLPETRKSARASVRKFFEFGVTTGRIASDPSARLPSVRVPPPYPRPTPEGVIRRAFAQADGRERLMLMFALFEAMRRAEIARVHTDDIRGEELLVHGKAARLRLIPLHPTLGQALQYVPAGFVFPGRIGGHLSPDYVGRRLSRLLDGPWSAHTLRHAALSSGYAATPDMRAVSAWAGHSSVATTQRYVRVPDGAMRAVVLGAATTTYV